MTTKSKALGPTATTADTKTTIGTAYKTPTAGTIRRIRIAGYNGVTDKATCAKLILESDQQKGPFEFTCYAAGEEVTVGGKRATEEIEVSIPTQAQEEWTVSVTSAEALEEVTVSLMWE